jgi:hypothetical protein
MQFGAVQQKFINVLKAHTVSMFRVKEKAMKASRKQLDRSVFDDYLFGFLSDLCLLFGSCSVQSPTVKVEPVLSPKT